MHTIVGHELLSFMDAYLSYNLILMHLVNQEKTSLFTECIIYYYKVKLFRLKNIWATYQCLMNKMFFEYLGDTMEVYTNDMLVKSLHVADHIP